MSALTHPKEVWVTVASGPLTCEGDVVGPEIWLLLFFVGVTGVAVVGALRLARRGGRTRRYDSHGK